MGCDAVVSGMNTYRSGLGVLMLVLAAGTGIGVPARAASAQGAGVAAPAKAEAAQASVTAERLMAHIKALPTSRAAWGDEASKKGLRDTEAQIIKKLTDLGYTPRLDPVDFLGSRSGDADAPPGEPWNNIFVDIQGKTRPNEVLILAAHFDAVPGSPGADDNGSGVATVLEAARVLKDAPMQRTVRLIFFNLEEVGLVGSRAYVERIKPDLEAKKERIVGMASIDMIGYYSSEPNSQKSPIPAMGKFKPPTVGDFIGVAGILTHRHFSQALDKAMHAAEPGDGGEKGVKTVVVDFLPIAPPDLLRSDHAPFLAVGVPAVIMSDTANFRSPHYHKATDTIETLDAERLAVGARSIIGAYHALAGPEGGTLIDLDPPKRPVPPAPAPAPAAQKPGPESKEPDAGAPGSGK